jgi:DNA-binding response OmpR family regulator
MAIALMKVLVVDDDQRIREALEIGLQLQWQDATVLTAADGEIGLRIFYDEEPDIVLLDVMMPRKNGFEVLRAIRQVSDVPGIMLTGRDEDVDQVRAARTRIKRPPVRAARACAAGSAASLTGEPSSGTRIFLNMDQR